MDTQSESPSLAELADAAGGLVAGLGILTIQIFPFALPLLVLVVGPLAVLGLAVAVLAIPLVLPLWLGRIALRALRRRRYSLAEAPEAIRYLEEGRARGKVPIDV